jgi:hypothetical protein
VHPAAPPLFGTWAERGKVHAWRRFSARHTLEIRFWLKSEPTGINHRREGTDLGDVALDGVIEITSRHGDPILGSFNLCLQIAKIVIRLQLRIVLTDREQPAERSCQRVLSLFKLAKLFTFVAFARAFTTSVSVDFSKFAAPSTVRTRFGMRSARR